RNTFRGGRSKFVNAADRVDGFLNLVADLGFDLLRRSAGLDSRHENRRDVDLRVPIDAEEGEREHANDGQRQDEHCRKDRPADRESGEPLHQDTFVPSASEVTLRVATRSPVLSPLTISTSESTV